MAVPQTAQVMDAAPVVSLVKCCNFAAIKHKDQRRKDPAQTPYINHPLGVADILVSEAGITDIAVLQAAILHDTIEDTDTSYDELVAVFGEKVAKIVQEVTDDKALSKEERKRMQVVNAPHKSFEAKLVKLADKLYNLRDLKRATPVDWSEQRVQEYFEWAAKVVAGLRSTNEAMESALQKLFDERGIDAPVRV